jgi:hypothetical protein
MLKAPRILERARELSRRGLGLDDPAVVRFTERFLELKQQAFRDLVDTAVELGEILVEARKALWGNYRRWIRERLQIDRSTADNYSALARLARESPAVIQRWKELGPSKLYQIARLPAPGRRAVLRLPRLQERTDREFSELVRPHRVLRRKVTGNMRAHGLRMKVEAWIRTLDGERLPRVENGALRVRLRQRLLDLARRARALAEGL